MARPVSDSQGALDRAREKVQQATDADSLRAAQTALLPLLGLSLDTTADIVGRNRWWVSRARNRFLRGEPTAKRGGRRHSLVDIDVEMELVKTAFKQSGVSMFRRDSVRKFLRNLLDKQSGVPVSESAITDMLDRVANQIIPGAKGSDLMQLESQFAMIWRLEEQVSKHLKDI